MWIIKCKAKRPRAENKNVQIKTLLTYATIFVVSIYFFKRIQHNLMKGNFLTITPDPQKKQDLDSTRDFDPLLCELHLNVLNEILYIFYHVNIILPQMP